VRLTTNGENFLPQVTIYWLAAQAFSLNHAAIHPQASNKAQQLVAVDPDLGISICISQRDCVM